MKTYEITYLIDSSLSTDEKEEYQKKIKEIIKEGGGLPGKEQSPAKIKLAYPIEEQSDAYFSSVDFEAEEENVKKIEEKIKEEDKILRYLLTKKPTRKYRKEKKRKTAKKKTLKPEKAKLKDIDKKIEEIL